MQTLRTPTTVLVPLSRLREDPDNPRQMPDAEMEKLVASIREFGIVEPFVARAEDNLLIGGHQRLAAVRRALGPDAEDTQVPVVYLEGLDDARVKILNLALNKIHGEWDFPKLAQVFEGLQTQGLDMGAMELSGFSSFEIEDVMGLMAPPDPDNAPDSDGADIDVDAALAAKARKFVFELATDDDARLVESTLRSFGMTGPSDAAGALVKVCRAALGNPTQAVEDVLTGEE